VKRIDNKPFRCYNVSIVGKQERETEMMNVTLAQAKRDFSIGYAVRFVIEQAPMSDGWRVLLARDEGAPYGDLVDARTKKMRVFKTLDAAVAALREIGFSVLVLS
jgi:hypothetical protein